MDCVRVSIPFGCLRREMGFPESASITFVSVKDEPVPTVVLVIRSPDFDFKLEEGEMFPVAVPLFHYDGNGGRKFLTWNVQGVDE